MATILIVDDHPLNREFLVTLLGYDNHRLLQATDGVEALALARAEHPHLMIADILMPTMDGYELVRQVRADAEIAPTPVIFCTAHYLEQEARALARQCGVVHILTKPCEPQEVLQAVNATLGHALPAVPRPTPDAFDRDHLRVLTNKLAESVTTGLQTNNQLSAMIEFSLQLASERDPERLLQALCHAARDLTGARHAVVGIRGEDEQMLRHVCSSGIDPNAAAAFAAPRPRQGLLDTLLVQAQPCRWQGLQGDVQAVGLPPGHPPVYACLGAPIVSPTHIYGWLCLTNKLGAEAFDEADEQLAGILAAQAGRIYENGRLYLSAQRHALALEQEIAERQSAQNALAERVRLTALAADIGLALTRGQTLPEALQPCAEAMVRHLDLAFARIWTLNPAENVLELQASAGLYTHLDGPHRRVPVGSLEIGLIAQECQPILSHAVRGDPRISDQAWVQREGIVAFAGHPLLVHNRVVGVMGLFARQPLPDIILGALRAVADEMALGIERFRTEEALQERERQLRALFESTLDAVAIINDEGEYLEVNPAACVLFGLSREACMGRRFTDFAASVAEFAQVWRTFRDQGHLSTTFRLPRPDGTVRDVECQAVANFIPGRHFIILRDITEHKHLEAQFLQAQKMEAIGRLAGGIAHDFNNMLTVIDSCSEIILAKLRLKGPERRLIEEIKRAVQHSATLTRQLLAFSRKQTLQPGLLDLNAVVTDMSNMLHRLLGEDIALLTKLAPALEPVKVDPGQIEQIMMNLAVNARDAMPGGGTLMVETADLRFDERSGLLHPEMPPGSYVLLAVSDTGEGMDQATQAHLFEPFFTTKEPGKGTGLGLASVYGMIKQSGGYISVYSEIGHGTTFKIYLPRAAAETPISPPSVPLPERRQGTETVLLVEDEATVRQLISRVLKMDGYTVLEASQGDEAVALGAQYPGIIHLLMTDVIMPGMSGPQLAERLTEVRPELKVLYMSGYTEHPLIHHGVLEPSVAFLQKPFTLLSLTQKVREVLNHRDDGECR